MTSSGAATVRTTHHTTANWQLTVTLSPPYITWVVVPGWDVQYSAPSAGHAIVTVAGVWICDKAQLAATSTTEGPGISISLFADGVRIPAGASTDNGLADANLDGAADSQWPWGAGSYVHRYQAGNTQVNWLPYSITAHLKLAAGSHVLQLRMMTDKPPGAMPCRVCGNAMSVTFIAS